MENKYLFMPFKILKQSKQATTTKNYVKSIYRRNIMLISLSADSLSLFPPLKMKKK